MRRMSTDLVDRSKGVLLGLMFGDALGAPFEGWPPSEIRSYALKELKSPSGLVNKFVEAVHMGTFVAGPEPGTYELAVGEVNLIAHVAKTQAEFFSSGDLQRGYPGTAQKGLRLIMEGVSYKETGEPPHFPFAGGSFANGGAMRISPLAVAFRESTAEVLRMAVEEAIRSSHRHPEAIDGAAAQARAVQFLLSSIPICSFGRPESDTLPGSEGGSRTETGEGRQGDSTPSSSALLQTGDFFGALRAVCRTDAYLSMLTALEERLKFFSHCNSQPEGDSHEKDEEREREEDASGPSVSGSEEDERELRSILKEYKRPGSGMGFQIASVHASACVFWIFWRYGRRRVRAMEAVQQAVGLGGDSDTVASMVGALVGALHGWAWIDTVLDGSTRRD
eukprot:Cvel_25467.t2-p1 / transcript=Cvel_25467.t2 / gene=Cvel_25467 / organism=Chromera_velia_CCMP2878 / gene_product=hypothetical protein / transcript_product=hypothetical protein / location=Cvel_scaffold2890:3278-4586(+) / protein_length=391 / sequence_SO=supercontig / SO=protein_coding / is_pseudo=false